MTFIQEQLHKFANLRGFIGASVSNIDGKLLGNIGDETTINVNRLAIILSHALNKTKMVTSSIDLGELEFLELDTLNYVTIAKCYHVNNIHFHIILILDRHLGNPAIYKLIMSEVADDLSTTLIL